jgi:alpha-amylase/alpha-mannosidase (GH57 family)
LGKLILATISLLLIISILQPLVPMVSSAGDKIYVAIVWHYHQPWYYSADESYFVLPWVRMHSVGNYYKMAYILSKYPDIKVSFTFSGSLLEQLIDMVENDKMDAREIISWRVVNGTLSREDVFKMLQIPGGFFDVNWGRIVDKSPRFSQLRSLAQSAWSQCSQIARSESELMNCVVDRFTGGNLSSQNVVDLAVLFNLLWIDPQVAQDEYPEVYSLMERAYTSSQPNYTISELRIVLNTHRDIMAKIIPAYKELALKSQAELVPVPYSHPLAPIIADLGFSEDLEIHISESMRLFKEYFNVTPRGAWPAEEAVNEEVLEAFKRAGVTWTITDESILGKTGVNTGDINVLGVPWYIDFQEGRIYVVFRDTELSNLISFQYSSQSYTNAVNDFINRILSLKASASGPRIIVVALDGENPWENYERFGDLFLNELYRRLSELQAQGVLETITPGSFIDLFPNVAQPLPLKTYVYLDIAGKDISNIPGNSYGDGYSELPRKVVQAHIPEGSWSGGEVATWIGDRQENIAWMWLVKARSEIIGKLGIQGFKSMYVQYPEIARSLLKAEASDWWWWYGGDGGGSPQTFDPLFKAYLRKAYQLAGLTPPDYLNVTAYPDGTPVGVLNTNVPKPSTYTPNIDGIIEQQWYTEISNGNGLRVPVGQVLDSLLILVEPGKLYFALNLTTVDTQGLRIGIYFSSPSTSLSPFNPGYQVYPRNSRVDLGIYLVKEILVDVAARTVTISNASVNGWNEVWRGNVSINVGGSFTTAEFYIDTARLNLPEGATTYLAAVLYSGDNVAEYSSRFGLVYQLQIPRGTISGATVFEMNDPIGDDDGPGGYGYPGNSVFKPGVFDITKFTVIDQGDKIVFKITFRDLGGNLWSGPNGWSLQQVHIYIHTSLGAKGNNTTIGLNAGIAEGYEWHMAIILAPGWGSDPIPVGERSAIYYYDKDKPVVQDSDFKVYADQADNSIMAEISKTLLYDVEDIKKWVYIAAVTSHDGYGTNKIRGFSVGGGEWLVSVSSNYSVAVLAGVIPYILDVLAPTSEEQYSMLLSFDPASNKLAQLKGYGATPVTITTTTTTTTTTVTTTTTTTTSTTPTTTTTTTATPIQQPSLDMGLLVTLVVVIIVVAIALVYLFRSKTGRP